MFGIASVAVSGFANVAVSDGANLTFWVAMSVLRE